MAGGAITLPRPPARRRRAFALTPLADVMFQLLIFFMLSTSLAPYALLPLGAPSTAAVAEAEGSEQSSGRSVIWHISAGAVREGTRTFALADLDAEIAALKGEGLGEIVLFSSPSATAQDLATVVEGIRLADVARVRFIARPVEDP